jgi:CheY-like chemotaxis protein
MGGAPNAASTNKSGSFVTTAVAFARGETGALDDTPGRGLRPGAGPPGPVLVVEDEALVREVTAEALAGAGYAVVQAANAGEAMEILETTPLLAVVTDVMMPGEIDGVGLASIVRAMSRDVPVLVVSACHNHLRLQDLPPGAPFLGKPYSDIQLIGAVQSLLGEARAAA